MLDAETLAEKLCELNQSGELRRTLIKHRIQNLLVYLRDEDSASGLCRWSLLSRANCWAYDANRPSGIYKLTRRKRK